MLSLVEITIVSYWCCLVSGGVWIMWYGRIEFSRITNRNLSFVVCVWMLDAVGSIHNRMEVATKYWRWLSTRAYPREIFRCKLTAWNVLKLFGEWCQSTACMNWANFWRGINWRHLRMCHWNERKAFRSSELPVCTRLSAQHAIYASRVYSECEHWLRACLRQQLKQPLCGCNAVSQVSLIWANFLITSRMSINSVVTTVTNN